MINEAKIKRIQSKLKSIISELEKEENIKIDFSNIRYNSAYYTTAMKVTCKSLGFTQNIIGMQFQTQEGFIREIIDIKTRNRKFPIIAKDVKSGVTYKYTTEEIKRLIGGDKIINRNANLDKLISE